ncbi:MAG TPA: VWA domain-containing protein [Candidatus Paceibacterota bacterium]
MKSHGGYVALISTIFISIVLLGLTFLLSTAGFYARADSLNSEYKRISLGLAESCSNVTLLKLARNNTYVPPSGGEVVTIGSESCTILEVGVPNQSEPTHKVIKTKASFRGAFSNMEIATIVQDPTVAPQIPANIFVVVQVVNDSGGTFNAGHFTVNLTAVNPSASSFLGDNGTLITADAGPYSVSETGPAGYLTTYSADCSGTAVEGVTKTCTIVNNDVPTTATLTVRIETVINNNGGLLGPSDFPLFIDGVSVSNNIGVTVSPGSHAVTGTGAAGYDASLWGFHCASSGTVTLAAGQSKTCTITYDDEPPPVAACADTVMMLDRTGSMSGPGITPGTDLFNERVAAKGLLDLYRGVTPTPQVGVGSFGNNAAATMVKNALGTFIGWLTSLYGMDGGAANTDFRSPSQNVQNGIGDNWTNPINAHTDGSGYARGEDGKRHWYHDFGFSVPAGAAINGLEVKVDAWSTDSTGCRLGTQLSWDGGLSWTSEKTVDLGGTEASFLLGSSIDDWSSSHTWQSSELSDSNLRVRVRDIDPGTTCDNGAVTNLDWIETRVHYTTYDDLYDAVDLATASSDGGTNIAEAITIVTNELNGPRHDPMKEKVLILLSDGETNIPIASTAAEAALDAADAAKLSGVEIFTIFFGIDESTPFIGKNLLAYIATGDVSVPVVTGHPHTSPSHQLGSVNDQPSASAENGDGDHFFISPTATDMPALFETIGTIVCPAAALLPSPPPPITGTLIVKKNVIKDNGGIAGASDFTMIISAINPSQSSFQGSELGVSVTVEPGAYSVDEGATGPYVKTFDGCSGTIAAGEIKTCTITNNDTPPPTPPPTLPPPPPNITIESWVEQP